MRVEVYKTIDIEAEVDVDLEDVLNECVARVADQEERFREVLSALDCMTRCMARISGETIARMKPDVRRIIRERLSAELARYAEVPA